jgi:molecular chaperone GrpE
MNEDQTESPVPGNSSTETPSPDMEALRQEADEHRDRYLRTAAELDNLRKRSAREVEAARKFGAERLAQAILPVRDSLEAGAAAAEKAGQTVLLDGQRATLRLLDEAFNACGIRHEALSLVPAPNVAPNTVIQVVQKGYELNERLLRAAKVLVASGEG